MATQEALPTTLEEAERQLSNAVYEATRLIERLEGAGLVSGNGHHARQKLAALAVEELRRRWNRRLEVKERTDGL